MCYSEDYTGGFQFFLITSWLITQFVIWKSLWNVIFIDVMINNKEGNSNCQLTTNVNKKQDDR